MTATSVLDDLLATLSDITGSVEIPSSVDTVETEASPQEETTPEEPEVTYPNYEGTVPSNIPSEPIVPENSMSILVNESTSRFSSAIWYSKIQEKRVLLAGLGGIGSYVSFLLSRMRPETLILYDGDVVEVGNMSGQLYASRHIGSSKVEAARDIANQFSDYYHTRSYSANFTRESRPEDIMICGFDNMEARKLFYESWKARVREKPNSEKVNCLFIDGRLAAEEFQVFCITGDDSYSMERYEREWLFSDDEADATVCSYKQTTYMANMIGSIIVNLFTNFCANQCDPIIPRDLPFITSYNASLMYFKTEV